MFNPFLFANECTEMKLKIYLSEAWMCSEFGMLITDVERERVNQPMHYIILHTFVYKGPTIRQNMHMKRNNLNVDYILNLINMFINH